jgi:hypothetical protein
VATGRKRRNPLGDQPSPPIARQSSNADKGKHLASVEKNLRRVFACPSRLLRAARDQPDLIASWRRLPPHISQAPHSPGHPSRVPKGIRAPDVPRSYPKDGWRA